MEPTYNFNSLWRAFSHTGQETLQLSVFQGNVSMALFRRGTESRRPVAKLGLSVAGLLQMQDILKTLIDSPPDTRMPFSSITFDRETRKYDIASTFVFFKDDKRCYGVEISNKMNPNPVKIMFKCANTFSTGSESMTEEQKSLFGIRELLAWFQHCMDAILLSRWNMENPAKQRQNGGNQQRGGYQRNNGGGSHDPYSKASEDDTLFS